MSLLAHAQAGARGVLAVARRRPPVGGAVVLAYHDVLADDVAVTPYAVSASRLRAQLDVVARLGLAVVSLRELSARLVAGASVEGCAAIVFDDALVGVHRLALPELARRGWPSTLHPVADRLGTDPPWWPGSQRTMTTAELAECVSLGVDLGAHGTTHACLPCLPDRALAEELRAPRERFEDLVGRSVDELAYPFGHVDPRVREAAEAAGYTTAYTFTNGRVSADGDRWRLPRLTMHERLSPLRLLQQLARRASDWPPVRDSEHPHDVIPSR